MLYARGNGRYEDEYGQLWDTLVPKAGQADTVQGELVRAIGRLASESHRNINLNWDQGFRHFVAFLRENLRARDVFSPTDIEEIEFDLDLISEFGNNIALLDCTADEEDSYDRIIDRVVEWCRAHPESIPHETNVMLGR
jgi:hypothetical protein